MNFSNKSLRFKLTALIAGIVLSLSVCFIAVTTYFAKQEEHVVLKGIESTAVGVADAVAAQFFERYGDVQAFAVNPDLQNPSKSVISEALNNYVTLYAIYDLIIVTDEHGKIVAANTKSPSGKDINSQALYGRNVSDSAWFKNTIAGKFTEDKEKNFAGTFVEDVELDTLVSEVYGDKRPGNSFSAQIKDKSGKVIGVVTNRAGSGWLELALTDGYGKLDEMGFDRGDVFLTNKNGVVLAAAIAKEVNSKAKVSRDFDFLMKSNLVENGDSAALKLKETQKPGYTWGYNQEEKYETAAGFAPVTGPKFIDSIGWKIVAHGPKDEILAATNQLKWFVYGILAVAMCLAMVAATLYSNALSARLREIAVGITENSNAVGNMAGQMAEASGELSSSTTEQAAALQETVSSIDEVSSMIAKNADNAKRSQDTSVVSSDAAQKGKQVVDEMIESIEVINRSNTDIMQQIEAGNQQIGEIVKVITEIGNKTKVINDIVFQTKLLSFNASVEAARAGEHGKGFAVVAEEVGNLAQMSGNAAKEISSMLEGSIQKVEQIVNDTRSRVDNLMKDSKAKVDAGTVTARRCGEVLDEIVKNVGDVSAMVAEIATASREQSQGVNEINKAMNQLDQVTQSNAAAAQQASTVAEQLRAQGSTMERVVSELISTVEGKGTARNTAAASASVPKETPKAGKVLSFQKNASVKAEVTKMAAGSNELPSRNDSRFEEV